jgi:hypothetical protein
MSARNHGALLKKLNLRPRCVGSHESMSERFPPAKRRRRCARSREGRANVLNGPRMEGSGVQPQQRFQSARVNIAGAKMKIWRIAVATGLIIGWMLNRRRSARELYQAHDRRRREALVRGPPRTYPRNWGTTV